MSFSFLAFRGCAFPFGVGLWTLVRLPGGAIVTQVFFRQRTYWRLLLILALSPSLQTRPARRRNAQRAVHRRRRLFQTTPLFFFPANPSATILSSAR